MHRPSLRTRLGAPRRNIGLALFLLTGCAGGTRPTVRATDLGPWEQKPGTPVLECESRGFSCVGTSMSPDAIELAIVLLDNALIRWQGGSELDEVADWLEVQPGVAWVDRFDGMVRFLPQGAMPLTIVSPDRGNLPTPTAPPGDRNTIGEIRGSTGAGSGPFQLESFEPSRAIFPAPFASQSASAHNPVFRTPATTTAWRQVIPDQVISDNRDFSKKPTKRALVLGNFDWEFSPRETEEVSNRIGLGREYQCEGCIDVRTTDYPRDHPLAPKCNAEADGQCLPIQRTSWRDFLGWEDFDLIHVNTHGYQACRPDGRCYSGIATGRIGGRGELFEGAARGSALNRLARYNLIRSHAGVSRPGVEYLVTGPSNVCRAQEVVSARDARMGGGLDPFDHPVTNPSSQAFDLLCNTMLWEMVTDDFFYAAYPSGLSDKLIVLNACESFRSPHLVRHLAAAGSTTIFGWQIPVFAPVGLNIMKHFYARLFPGSFGGGDGAGDRGGGARAGVAWADALKRYYLPVPVEAAALPKSPGRVPAPDSSSYQDKRPMELVYLVDPETNLEVRDTASVTLLGIAGDGRPDSIAVLAEVHGLAEEPDLAGFRIGFRVDGKPLSATYPLSRRIDDEGWAFVGRVPLGRDATPGERVDLDLSVEIPRGGMTRWLYEDLLLMSACSFSGRITEIRIREPRERFLSMVGDYRGRAVVDGDGNLFLSIQNEGNPQTDHGTPDVTRFGVRLHHSPDGPNHTLGSFAIPAAGLSLTRPNRYFNPSRTERGARILDSTFQSPILSPKMAGSMNLTAFTTTRMAGSLRIPFETNGVQGLFEGDFDAGSSQSCGVVW